MNLVYQPIGVRNTSDFFAFTGLVLLHADDAGLYAQQSGTKIGVDSFTGVGERVTAELFLTPVSSWCVWLMTAEATETGAAESDHIEC
jgi:hypothetical protein